MAQAPDQVSEKVTITIGTFVFADIPVTAFSSSTDRVTRDTVLLGKQRTRKTQRVTGFPVNFTLVDEVPGWAAAMRLYDAGVDAQRKVPVALVHTITYPETGTITQTSFSVGTILTDPRSTGVDADSSFEVALSFENRAQL